MIVTFSYEATMDPLTRRMREVEKPGRLELAIVEWQRQLVRRRERTTAKRLESSGGEEAGRQMLPDNSAAA